MSWSNRWLSGVPFHIVAWCVPIVCALGARSEAAVPSVVQLRCEYLVNPLGIDQRNPRLSWRLESESRAVWQTGYRILVASSADLLAPDRADLWDSGDVSGSATNQIAYQGRPLTSREGCCWKVRVRGTVAGQPFECESGVATWTMGLLDRADWRAEYISYRDETPVFTDPGSLFLPPARQYRKQFAIPDRPIRRATIYATGLGIYELHVNGKRVSDQWFAPGWTDYRQRAYYQTYDVTGSIGAGANALAAWVADGWYSGYVGFGLLTGIGTEKIGRYTYGKTPSVLVQLEIEYADGSREVIVSDASWKVTGSGPIREADLLMGEFYDARQELPGWATAGYDDSAWEQAIPAGASGTPKATFYEFRNPDGAGEGPTIKGREVDLGFARPELQAFPGVPVRVTAEIKPISVKELSPGKYIVNLGQNIAGNVRMEVKGPPGLRVVLRYGEMLHPDGQLMTENLRKARAIDCYVLKGDPAGEVFTPRFTCHGFQYVEATVGDVDDQSAQPRTPPTITGLVLHSDTPLASSFECTDPMVNRLFQNVVWTQRANFIDLPTDCPQRDERMGWTGDAQVYIGTAAYNADVGAFYTKWLRELMESQRPSGAFPGYAPFPFQHGWDFGTAWADAGIICPWTIWQAYGDTSVIRTCWAPMTRFMQWRTNTSREGLGINHGNEWGDWLAQGEVTPIDYIDTVYFAITSRLMSEMAGAIERRDEQAAYERQFDAIKTAFNQKYVKDDGSLLVDTQTAYALALYADLIPHRMRRATGEILAGKIQQNGTRMATGFLGTRPLLPVLSSVGQHDLAGFLFQSRAFPSWGYEVEQGATTIWERWDSFTKEEGFGRHNAAMNSFAHYAFGAVCEWMFQSLAGIRSDGPGYRKIIIRPMPPSPGSNAERQPIDWVKASHDAITGRIVSAWRIQDKRFELVVSIPANTSATVFVPAASLEKVTERDAPIADAAHVRFLRMESGCAVLEVESGDYHFASQDAIARAGSAFKTSERPDISTNPQNVDLTNARVVARWDFTKEDDVAAWSAWHNLSVQQRDGLSFLVATGDDPQMEIQLAEPLSGRLAVKLEAQPVKGTNAQFFWASASGHFSPQATNARALNPATEMNEYLFTIEGDGPVQKLRFDPFPNQGEMRVQALTVLQLPD